MTEDGPLATETPTHGQSDGRLNRIALGIPADEVRIIHLGVGAFSRAHQAWYTHVLAHSFGQHWGISAFTGRRPDEAERLAAQDGLFTLITRASTADSAEIVTSISEAHTAVDVDSWLAGFGNPRVSVVTLTITEAGYCRNSDDGVNVDLPDVAADIRALREGTRSPLATAPGKLVQGLNERRRLGHGGLTILSCDNLASNGDITRRVVIELCDLVDADLGEWARANIRFPNSMVDRITPRTTPDDLADAERLTGWRDDSPVVTEPFTEWVIERDFAADRPEWELAGALVVDDVSPYERRKLLMLNGGHSLLAYVGLARGRSTVAEAIADPVCRALVDQWWAEASELVAFDSVELSRYRSSLLDRWANPRIAHTLDQIALDGSQKLPLRSIPVLRHFRAEGRMPFAAIATVAGWMVHLANTELVGPDSILRSLVAHSAHASAATATLQYLAPDLADDRDLIDAVAQEYRRLLAPTSE